MVHHMVNIYKRYDMNIVAEITRIRGYLLYKQHADKGIIIYGHPK